MTEPLHARAFAATRFTAEANGKRDRSPGSGEPMSSGSKAILFLYNARFVF
jgi:hypothetical protein